MAPGHGRALFLPSVCLAVAVILLVCVLSASAAPLAVDLDLTGKENSSNTKYTAADILDSIVGDVTDAERAYLTQYGGVSVFLDIVDNSVAYQNVSLDLNDGALEVIATVYNYTAKNGDTVSWYPYSVTVGDVSREFVKDGDTYNASFDGVSQEGLIAKIRYYTEVTLGAETLNSILFRVSEDIRSIKSEKDAMDAANKLAEEAYEAAVKAYEKNNELWTIYWRNKADYEDFLAREKNYYEVWLPQYEKDLEAYRKYEAYLEAVDRYESDLKKYSEYVDYTSYIEYLAQMQTVRDQLTNLDSMNIPMSNSKVSDRTVYAAILTGLDFIITNQDALKENTDADPEAINLAAEVTPLLKKELDLYFGLTDEAEKYEFYIANSANLCQHLSDLTRSLYRLYQDSTIRGAISQQGKKDKFELMIAQLIMVSNAINGSEITNFEGTATLGYDTVVHKFDNSTVGSLLMNKMSEYVNDVDPTPLDGGYPEYREEVQKPQHNVTVEPTKPTWTGAIPVAPEFKEVPVYNGEMPVEPTEKITHPGERPQPQTMEAAKLALLEAYESGELVGISDRVGFNDDHAVGLFCSALRYYDDSKVDVRFHVNGRVFTEKVIKGAEVVKYTHESPPTHYEDERGEYYFDGWTDENGNHYATLGYFTESVDLYPHYYFSPKKFTVTFIVGDEETPVTLKYGEIPTYPGTPTIPDDDSYYYVFEKWDRDIVAVDSNATYTAVFDRIPVFSVGDTAADITVEDRFIVADCGSAEMTELDIGGLLSRVESYAQQGMAFGITVKNSALSLTLPYSTARALMNEHGGVVLRPSIDLGKYGGTVSIEMVCNDELARGRAADNTDSVISAGSAYTVDVRLFLASAAILPYTVRDENGNIVKSSADGSYLGFTATVGAVYTLSVEYSLCITVPEGVTVTVMGQRVEAGQSLVLTLTPDQTVDVTVDSVTDGYRVTSVGFTVGGVTTELPLGGGSFAMPQGDVVLDLGVEHITYKIEFYNRGKLVRSFECFLGDTVTVPTALSYSIDGNICYYFEGWAADDGTLLGSQLTVSGDAVYNAVLREEVVEMPTAQTDGTSRLERLLVAYKVCLWMIRLVVIPSLILGLAFIVIARTKRRR